MGQYNAHFASKFEGCMIVGRLKDEGRKRTVTCYAIPGEPEVVGLYDGVDVWVGSASTFSKDIRDHLDYVFVQGLPLEVELGQTRMRLHDPEGVMGYPALDAMPVHKPRLMAKARMMAKPQPKARIVAGSRA